MSGRKGAAPLRGAGGAGAVLVGRVRVIRSDTVVLLATAAVGVTAGPMGVGLPAAVPAPVGRRARRC
ncbi:hypothetical protein GCM10020229_07110 [Kitasatospora albolonga]